MCILLVLGKNIEATKVTKLNAEKLPILPKPPKSFTQPQIKKSNVIFRVTYIKYNLSVTSQIYLKSF